MRRRSRTATILLFNILNPDAESPAIFCGGCCFGVLLRVVSLSILTVANVIEVTMLDV
jgi:hypothetical protein